MSAIITSAMLLIGSWHAAYIEDNCTRCPDCCTTQEQVLLEHYVEQSVRLGATEQMARDLLHVEVLAGIPKHLRGMVLAKAAHESRFTPRAIGDNGKAVGPDSSYMTAPTRAPALTFSLAGWSQPSARCIATAPRCGTDGSSPGYA